MKKNFFSVIAIALSTLLFSACGQQAQELYTPTAAPLPSSGDIDWNVVPEVWTGTGGTKASESLKWDIYEGLDYDAVPIYDTSGSNYMTDDGISVYNYICHFTGLPDEAMQNKLNGDIQKAMDNYLSKRDFFEKYTPKDKDKYGEIDLTKSVYSDVAFSGNVLSVNLIFDDSIWAVENAEQDLFYSKSATSYASFCYDLLTGKQLALSDLFIEGADLDELLGGLIAENLSGRFELSRPFRGLPENYPHFMLMGEYLTFYFPTPNPYSEYLIAEVPIYKIADYMAQPTATFSDIFGDENTQYFYRSATEDTMRIRLDKDRQKVTPFGIEEYDFQPQFVASKEHPEAAEKINADLEKIYDSLGSLPFPQAWQEVIDGGFNNYKYSYCDLQLYRPFVMFSFNAAFGTYVDGDTGQYVRLCRCYDSYTGDVIPLENLIADKEGFEAYCKAQGIELEEGFSNFGTYMPNKVYMYPETVFDEGRYDEGYYSDIPAEFINDEYFKNHK